jgi:hypothetical protein
MVVAAPYCGSYTLWYRAEVKCCLCGSPSSLKLVEGEFICAWGCPPRPRSPRKVPAVEQLDLLGMQ